MTDTVGSSSERLLTFGPFRLMPDRKLLLAGEAPVRLGGKALDILILLADRAGEVVAKDDLVASVWPDSLVDDANLRVHVAALRKALGEGRDGARYITNVPGRGYCFVAPVVQVETAVMPPPQTSPGPGAGGHTPPVRLTRVLGRESLIQTLSQQLPARRFVTLVGPGGIGKTTVALALAEAIGARYADGVRFVDFAPVTDAALGDATLAASVLAGALGVAVESIADLGGILQDRKMLLILDNCEHVVGTAAVLAEAVLRGAPGVHILATSREPLLAEGEWVQRLASLETPPVTAAVDAAQALTYSAVALFVERAAASDGTFTFGDAEVPLVIEICRGLDGIPLAIELAAARLDLFGLRGLAERLHDRFALLVRGRRTALPRHQTLRATLDWSYELLPPVERSVLHRLAVFAGGFSMESAVIVAGDALSTRTDILVALSNLVAKSLLVADVGGNGPQYRLLEMTRAYAMEKLSSSGELPRVLRRHAECHRDLLVRAEQEWDQRPTAEWLDVYGRQIDNLRAALIWAFGPEGDTCLGIALTAAAVPLWMQLSLMNECREAVRRALEMVPPPPADAPPGPEAEAAMRLLSALGLSLIYTKGPAPEIRAALGQALTLARRLDAVDYQLRVLWGLYVETFNEGHYAQALEISDRFRAVAVRSADPVDLMAADRMRGFALHLIGDHAAGRRYIEDGLRRYVRPAHRGHLVRYQYDQRVAACVPLSVILWIQGYPDKAAAMVAMAVEEAQRIDHALTLGYVLSTAACQVSFLVGDLAAVERHVSLLQDQSTRHGLGPWAVLARYFRHRLQVVRGDTASGLAGMGAALAELEALNFRLRLIGYQGEWAEALGQAGLGRQGLVAVDRALDRSETQGIRWVMPELLRIKGELLLREDGPDGPQAAAHAAEAHFQDALSWAQRQGSLSWELRAALSLGRLWRGQGRPADAHALLTEVQGRFTEGFQTADLIAARDLVASLSQDMVGQDMACPGAGGASDGAAPARPAPCVLPADVHPSGLSDPWDGEVVPFPGIAC